jgi:hypothetical protein
MVDGVAAIPQVYHSREGMSKRRTHGAFRILRDDVQQIQYTGARSGSKPGKTVRGEDEYGLV